MIRRKEPMVTGAKENIVIGIDPGLTALGYGIVESRNGTAHYVTSGTIRTRSADPYAERLLLLHNRIEELIKEYAPAAIAMERPIYCQNVKTALALGQAGGMAILAAARQGIHLVEFTPAEVKQAVVGKGQAGKDQVERMVRVLLSLEQTPATSHASDALACAICYVHSEKRLRILEQAGIAQGSSPTGKKSR